MRECTLLSLAAHCFHISAEPAAPGQYNPPSSECVQLAVVQLTKKLPWAWTRGIPCAVMLYLEPQQEEPAVEHTDVFRRVTVTVAETLSLDLRYVHPTSKLCGDLGAESIDIIDLLFRLEHEFRIHIPSHDFNPAALLQQHPEYVEAGMVTQAGLAALRTRWPFVDLDAFAENPQQSELNDLFTVETVARYIMTRLQAVP